jgi:hypothetical protein
MRAKRQREKQQKKEQEKQAEVKQRQEAKVFQRRVTTLIESLGETNDRALLQIDRIIERIGIDFAEQKLGETEEVEAQGGLMVPVENRRRTKGGVFFFLVKKVLKEEGRKEDMKEIFYKNQYPKREEVQEGEKETDKRQGEQKETAAKSTEAQKEKKAGKGEKKGKGDKQSNQKIQAPQSAA